MVIFASLCALAIVFVWKFLPETKGLPVEEIVKVFERQQVRAATYYGVSVNIFEKIPNQGAAFGGFVAPPVTLGVRPDGRRGRMHERAAPGGTPAPCSRAAGP